MPAKPATEPPCINQLNNRVFFACCKGDNRTIIDMYKEVNQVITSFKDSIITTS